MYRSVRLLLPHYVAKEFLSFLFHNDLDRVQEIRFGNISEVQQFLTEDLSQNFDVPVVAKHLSYVTLIKRTKAPFSIQLPATLNLLSSKDAGETYFLDISFSIQTQMKVRVERPHSPFGLDLHTNMWYCGEFEGRFSVRDNNVPLEIQGTASTLAKLLDDSSSKDKLQLLLTLATLIRPTYHSECVEYDLVSKAREICIEKQILTQDDIDLIESETNFIIYGEENELKYQPK